MTRTSANSTPPLYGLLAEFEQPDALIAAVTAARTAGYQQMGAYTPYPVEGLSESLGFRHTRIPLVVLLGGILGGLTGFGMQYYAMAVNYPLNIGGRPLNSWPMFIPITFELTILFAAFFAILGLFALNGLPQPYHPLFNVPSFARATRDRFFLCIQAGDEKFDRERTRAFLASLGPKEISEVPP